MYLEIMRLINLLEYSELIFLANKHWLCSIFSKSLSSKIAGILLFL